MVKTHADKLPCQAAAWELRFERRATALISMGEPSGKTEPEANSLWPLFAERNHPRYTWAHTLVNEIFKFSVCLEAGAGRQF